MPTPVACTVYLLIDEDGDCAVGKTMENLDTEYCDEFDKGSMTARRIVKVTVHVTPPCTVELTGTAPDVDGAAGLEVQ